MTETGKIAWVPWSIAVADLDPLGCRFRIGRHAPDPRDFTTFPDIPEPGSRRPVQRSHNLLHRTCEDITCSSDDGVAS